MSRLLEKHLIVWLFSNPGDNVQILVESAGQIWPVDLYPFWTLSPGFENNRTFKCWSGIFPNILTYMIMLENCLNNISMYGCSPIQGKFFYSCGNFTKPGSQSGKYIYFFKNIFCIVQCSVVSSHCSVASWLAGFTRAITATHPVQKVVQSGFGLLHFAKEGEEKIWL